MKHPRAAWLLIPILFACRIAGADDATPALKGGWVATAGPSAFRGRWTAVPQAADPNTVQGTWTLIDARDETVATGTWSGRQQGRRWRGLWSARTADGHLFSGSFQADAPAQKGGSFADLLAASATQQITGSWRMGGMRGRWWLKG